MMHGCRLLVFLSAIAACGCESTIVRTESGGRFQPPGSIGEVQSAPAASILDQPVDKPSAVYHRVVKGETLSAIARRYAVSLNAVIQANGLDPDATIQPGQLIFIPST